MPALLAVASAMSDETRVRILCSIRDGDAIMSVGRAMRRVARIDPVKLCCKQRECAAC